MKYIIIEKTIGGFRMVKRQKGEAERVSEKKERDASGETTPKQERMRELGRRRRKNKVNNNQKGHSDLGAVLGLALLIVVVGGVIDLGLIVLAIISFIKWSSGLGVILLISALVVSLIGYWLLKRVGS